MAREIPVDDWEECPNCQGKGQLQSEPYYMDDGEVWEVCPECDGKGAFLVTRWIDVDRALDAGLGR